MHHSGRIFAFAWLSVYLTLSSKRHISPFIGNGLSSRISLTFVSTHYHLPYFIDPVVYLPASLPSSCHRSSLSCGRFLSYSHLRSDSLHLPSPSSRLLWFPLTCRVPLTVNFIRSRNQYSTFPLFVRHPPFIASNLVSVPWSALVSVSYRNSADLLSD